MLRRMLLLVVLLMTTLPVASCAPGWRERAAARVAALPYYRAVAYSPSTHVCGFTEQNAGQDASLAEATRNCGAADCGDNSRWVQSGCLAIARGPGTSWGWGMAGDRHAATWEALRPVPRPRLRLRGRPCRTCTDPPP